MKKIISYYLNFKPKGNGKVIFRLEGENENRTVILNSSDFSAVATLLMQKRITYHLESGTFISYDDSNLPITNPDIIT